MVRDVQSYDVIGFGDEVPGVLALIAAAREFRRRTNKFPRILLMSKGNLQEGIGGHLVRGRLAYLDRTQIDAETRKKYNLGTFGDPASLYKEFLQKAAVNGIALDPEKADQALRQMLKEAGVNLLSNVKIVSVTKSGQNLSGIVASNGVTYSAKVFIDSTVNAELAQAAGVKKHKGFETFGLPESELPVTLVIETQGLSVKRIKELDFTYNKRFTNPGDQEAQKFLMQAAGYDAKLAENLKKEMLDARGNLRTLWAGNDHIDIRSPALSVAYHSFRGVKMSLEQTGILYDEGNVAILPGERLSWNAMLFKVSGSEAESLARNGGKPTPKMLQEFQFAETWLKSLGASSVTPASELYIRHAGNVIGVVEPLNGSKMLFGGVPQNEAIATFSYHFDVRGGIPGLGDKASTKGWGKGLNFKPPLFNIGIRHALIKNVPNLAVVSPGSGFEGFASSAGRIVEFNAAVGQGLGIAAIIALLNNRNLADITNLDVRKVLDQTGQTSRIFGQNFSLEGTLLAQFEKLVLGPVVA